MDQMFNVPGAHGFMAGDHNAQFNAFWTPPPRVVAWPVRVGVPPPLADCLQPRAELEVTPGSVLSGPGGVGKSQLAANFVARHRAELDLVLWVTATERTSIVSRYAQAAQEIGVAAGALGDAAATRFLEWLAATNRRWLIVLDDVADPADMRGLWPPWSGWTLATTRRRDGALAGRLIEVGLFTHKEARAYMRAKLASHPTLADDIEGVVDDLGRLPIALAQAAVYLLDEGISCAEYRTRFATLPLDRLVSGSLPDDHQFTVDKTWSLSIEAADRQDPAGIAKPLLQLASLLDPEGIPFPVLTAAPVLAHLGADVDAVRRAVRVLHRYHLATHDPANPARSLQVHALIQRASREHTDPETLDRIAVAAADALDAAWPDVERDTGLGQSLRGNVNVLAANRPDPLWHPREGAHAVLLKAGVSLGEKGQVHAAALHFGQLRDTATAVLGSEHRHTLTIRHWLAFWRSQAGDARAGVAAFEELLQDAMAVLGNDHPITLIVRGNLARSRGEAGDVTGAVAAAEETLAAMTRALGPDHVYTLAARSNLARWQAWAGDRAHALTGNETLFADRLRVLGADHTQTMQTRNNMWLLRAETGDVHGAVIGFAELLTDMLRVLGPQHPDTLIVRRNLVIWRGEAGDPADALAGLEELLADASQVLPASHVFILTTRARLADLRGRAGNVADAVAALDSVLADMVRLLSTDHLEIGRVRADLGRWRAQRGSGDPS